MSGAPLCQGPPTSEHGALRDGVLLDLRVIEQQTSSTAKGNACGLPVRGTRRDMGFMQVCTPGQARGRSTRQGAVRRVRWSAPLVSSGASLALLRHKAQEPFAAGFVCMGVGPGQRNRQGNTPSTSHTLSSLVHGWQKVRGLAKWPYTYTR